MPHSKQDIQHYMHQIGNHTGGHTAKKTALFDAVQGMVIASTHEGRSAGLNAAAAHGVPLAVAEAIVDAALKDFVETTQHFTDLRHQVIATDLM
jgi:hypothetical protein